MSAAEDRKFASTLARGLSVLSAFRAGDDGLSHAQIAQRTGLPKPTISRLTYTLCRIGYLTHGGRNDRFRLGPAAIGLGAIAGLSVSFLDLITECMQDLANETGTLTYVSLRDGDQMMILKVWRPNEVNAIWLEAGQRIPVYGSACGMAILATLPDAQFEAMLPETTLHRYRSEGYDQLLAQGYTVPPAALRYSKSVSAVSVPYFVSDMAMSVGFSCAGLPATLSTARINEDVGPALRAVVRDLEDRTGQTSAVARRG